MNKGVMDLVRRDLQISEPEMNEIEEFVKDHMNRDGKSSNEYTFGDALKSTFETTLLNGKQKVALSFMLGMFCSEQQYSIEEMINVKKNDQMAA